MDYSTLTTLAINAIATPILVLVTMWIRNANSKDERREKRDDNFIRGMAERIDALEKEIREVRIELKNRDAEYLELYKSYTTLKARYEVLEIDHADLKKKYEHTVAELASLGTNVSK